ncbi:MAG: hypothetical protein A3F91_09190 [Flavobacteria bacterium RIFCSPLOWO2_12_FULL_35_11]|nr:MAG: hypothetical protein A3F91_09190 [Flavobacteria bacterium RIFCSPLOWO2_12_FULL_35_11]
MSDKEFLDIVAKELFTKENLTEAEIEIRAYEKVKSMRQILPNKYFHYKNMDKKIIFMAGSPGAGKSETAQLILRDRFKIDIIDTDEIRKELSEDGGKNAHLYQKASSKGVSILIDYAFKNGFSFILDGNFAEYDVQKKNIDRAIKHGYEIEIVFVSRAIDAAQRFTKIREEKSGRRVPDDVFIEKSMGAIETVRKFISDVRVDFYDLEHGEIKKDISKEEFNSLTSNNFNILCSMLEVQKLLNGNGLSSKECEDAVRALADGDSGLKLG